MRGPPSPVGVVIARTTLRAWLKQNLTLSVVIDEHNDEDEHDDHDGHGHDDDGGSDGMMAVVVLMVVDGGGMNRAGARRSDASGARSGERPQIPVSPMRDAMRTALPFPQFSAPRVKPSAMLGLAA